jgi:hypothetical protein
MLMILFYFPPGIMGKKIFFRWGKNLENRVDYKYNTCNPNVFTCRDDGASNFWKGVLWAARVVKMGYR